VTPAGEAPHGGPRAGAAKAPLFVRALAFTVIVPGTLCAWLPWWLVRAAREHDWPGAHAELGALRWLGWLLIGAGGAGYLLCVVDFGRRGQGTPNPMDPPRRFVASGLYRHVRNPMYVCIGGLLLGEALAYEAPLLAALPAALWIAFHLFVVLYEEPVLARTFGDSYADYRRRVPRWIPRLRAG
jgi:protein-S-isoprenylcysteine O-methyltransferase Ste14